MLEIEKNIPIPHQREPRRYKFERLEIGDSFPIETVIDLKMIKNSARGYRDRHRGWNFRTAPEGIHYRFWRIA